MNDLVSPYNTSGDPNGNTAAQLRRATRRLEEREAENWKLKAENARMQAEVERLSGLLERQRVEEGTWGEPIRSLVANAGTMNSPVYWQEYAEITNDLLNQAKAEIERMTASACTCTRRLDGPPTEPGWYRYDHKSWCGMIELGWEPLIHRDGLMQLAVIADSVECGFVGCLPGEMIGTWYGPICEPKSTEEGQ